jgi:hypothetical protein
MPVARGSFPASIELESAKKDLSIKQAANIKASADLQANPPPSPFGGSSMIRSILWSRHNRAQKAADDARKESLNAQNHLSRLTEKWSINLRNAIAERWIQAAVNNRCREDETSNGCINNAKIDELKARIPIERTWVFPSVRISPLSM